MATSDTCSDGDALDGKHDDLARAAIGVCRGLGLDLADDPRHVLASVLLDRLEQLLLGLFLRHGSHAL